MRQLREHIVYNYVKAIMTQCFSSKNKYTFYIFARMYIYIYIKLYTEYRTFNNACSFRYTIQNVSQILGSITNGINQRLVVH